MTIVEYPACRLIGMLAGPQTMSSGEARETEAMIDDVGYRSQQVFTQEKYVYLYYQGLKILEDLYEQGLAHGQIKASSMKISDSYQLVLDELLLSTWYQNFKDIPNDQQNTATTKARGFQISAVSPELKATIGQQIDQTNVQQIMQKNFVMRDLIQEDWRDFVASFYFPQINKCITDPAIRNFIKDTNEQLQEQGQEPYVIKLIVEKAQILFINQLEILETLMDNLKDEEMFEAVVTVAEEVLRIG